MRVGDGGNVIPNARAPISSLDDHATLGPAGADEPRAPSTHPVTPEYLAMLEAVGQNNTDLIAIVDALGRVVYGNPVAQKLFGVTVEEAMGTQARLYLHPDDLEKNLKFFADVVATAGSSTRQDVRTLSPSGEVRQLEVVCTNLLDDPSIHGIVINGKDVTERYEYVARLQALEERFRVAFEENMAPMSFTDVDDRLLDVNDAFCEMVGYSRIELLGRDSTLFTHPDDVGVTEASHDRVVNGEVDRVRYVKRYQRKDGQIIDVEVSRAPARDPLGTILYFVFSERDVTEERKLTAQLSHQALYDALTGLANRTLIEAQLAKARANVKRHGGLNALFLLDLDDFKGVNDTRGHLRGDELLNGVARRFEAVTRPSDTLCRFGGDEFLYLAEGLSSMQDVTSIARRLLGALEAPFHFVDGTVEQRASVGVVAWGAHEADDVNLLENADVALYEAKHHHRGNIVLYEPSMHEEASHRFLLVQELRNALARGELELFYQPIVKLPDASVVGFEGLLRWRHAQRGWVAPSEFIPLAERSDTIFDIGLFALESAVAAASSWLQATSPDRAPFVCVNLSAKQFHSPTLVPLIEATLARHRLPPSKLVLEITEGVAIANVGDTMNTLSRLERLGVGVALDDFGTGFSSLSYLATINPRIIKVDQSFVRLASSSPRDATLLEAIITLGHNLGVTMLAEGIETRDQFARLTGLRCQLAQGFLFSPAVPAARAALMVGGGFDANTSQALLF